jgi:probable rRNA maturation factor
MNVIIDFSNAAGDWATQQSRVPDQDQFLRWVNATLRQVGHDNGGRQTVIGIRLIDETESSELNGQYRGKPCPTNVLSFAHELPDDILDALGEEPLGDLAICAPVVAREAVEQGKEIQDHWAHLTIHGTLHLLGHDHQQDDEAEAMEALEVRILEGFGINNPYATN